MKTELTATELARNFADYLNRVAYRGESFVITRGNKPVAEFGPLLLTVRGRDLASVFESVPHLDPEDAELFAQELEEIRRLGNQSAGDPWEDYSTATS